MAEEWITCSRCGLRHSPRPGGLCPRCSQPALAAAGAPPEDTVAPPGRPARRRRVFGLVAGFGLLLAAALGIMAWRWIQADADDSPVVATFPAGRITLNDLERELAATPPGFKVASGAYLHELTRALVYRRALALEARAAGHRTSERGAQGERDLIRALLKGLATPQSHEEATAHRRRFDELANRALAGGVVIHDGVLKGVRVDPWRPIVAPPGPFAGPPQAFYLGDPGNFLRACSGVIDPGRRWFTGRCVGDVPLDFDPIEIVWLEATYGPSGGFLRAFAYDGREPLRYLPLQGELGHVGMPVDALPKDLPPDVEARIHLALSSTAATGDVDPEAAPSWFQRVASAFESCAAHYYWLANRGEQAAVFTVRLELRDGAVERGSIDVEGLDPPDPGIGNFIRHSGGDVAECLYPLRVFRMAGTGVVTYRVGLKLD